MSGKLGSIDLAATSNTVLFTGAVDKVTTANINFCNRNSASVQVRIAIENGATGTPSASEYLEFDAIIPANGVLERTGLVISAGDSVVVYSNTSQVSVNAWGFES